MGDLKIGVGDAWPRPGSPPLPSNGEDPPEKTEPHLPPRKLSEKNLGHSLCPTVPSARLPWVTVILTAHPKGTKSPAPSLSSKILGTQTVPLFTADPRAGHRHLVKT